MNSKKSILGVIAATRQSLWKTFISVRLTITLLVCLTAVSIVGTLIAQQGTTQVPIEQLYSPQVLKWFVAFGLTDIYHSAFFVFLMFMLAMNLISCSIERLPNVWRQAFRISPPPMSDAALQEWTPEFARKQKFLIDRLGSEKFESVREAKMAAMYFFEKNFGKGFLGKKTAPKFVVLRDHEDSFQLMIEHGKYSRLGVYITHLSLLLIMFGSVLGALIGFEGGMSIEEGTRVSWMQHLKGSNAGMPLMTENGVPVKGFLNLGFEVECERFTLETYDGERPKAFKSLLNFYENDVKVFSTEIAVNHPAVYKGITFYQASYNEVGIGGVGLKVFRMAKPKPSRNPSSETRGGFEAALSDQLKGATQGAPSLLGKEGMPKVESVELVENVKLGELYRVDGDGAFRVQRVEPNLMDLGPAARIQYYPSKTAKKPQEFWIFKNLPGFDFAHRRGTALSFVLETVKPKYATGLSIARDPGVWVVWIGSLILVFALFLALYTCHSRYWLAYTRKNGFVAAGWSNKLFLFEPRYEKFLAALREELKS